MRTGRRAVLGLLLVCTLVPMLRAEGVLSVTASPAPAGAEGVVNLVLTGAPATGALDVEIAFPPEALKFLRAETGKVAANGQVQANVPQPGLLKVALVDMDGLDGDGAVVALSFQVNAASGTRVPLKIVSATANHHEAMVEIPLEVRNGELEVTAPAKSILPSQFQLILIGTGVGVVVLLLLVWLAMRGKKHS